MESSRDCRDDLLPEHSALQHERAPRPLPLFLELVRRLSESEPQIARDALRGLAAYGRAPRPEPAEPQPISATAGPATLRDHGGSGPPLVLVPSLINPPHILDLDREVSLAAALSGMNRHVFLLDWGPASERAGLSVSGHIEQLLLPLLISLAEPPALAGYCLGGTMAIAAANLVQCERVATLAAPWNFAAYPDEARQSLAEMWSHSQATAQALGALPMEVLQAAFWSLDPARTVSKFAQFSALDPAGPDASRFIALEDWANDGDPLPFPAARELIEDLFGRDMPGSGRWHVGGRAVTDELTCPLLNLLAERDRIAPAATAAAGESVVIAAGHVGMVIGSARERLHAELGRFLATSLAAGSSQG
jgi:polyhydroxyalkanoate synthase